MKKKILVVDDELEARTFICTLLETNGFHPVAAEDGEVAFDLAKADPPALVVLDVMMPRESGIRMYRKLKADPDLCSVPVVMVSSVTRDSFLHCHRRINDLGGRLISEPEAYLEKPPSAEELLHHVIALTKS